MPRVNPDPSNFGAGYGFSVSRPPAFKRIRDRVFPDAIPDLTTSHGTPYLKVIRDVPHVSRTMEHDLLGSLAQYADYGGKADLSGQRIPLVAKGELFRESYGLLGSWATVFPSGPWVNCSPTTLSSHWKFYKMPKKY